MKLQSLSLRERALGRIEQYPFTQVKEKLLKEGKLDPTVVDEAIAEFRKYLRLIALGNKGVGMLSREVDEVWHTFILFTCDYALFCHEVFGHFLHHQPSVPSQPLGEEPRRSFLEAYRREFGEPPAIWDVSIHAGDGPTDGCCGEQCSPDPSCSGEPDPTIMAHNRPILARV